MYYYISIVLIVIKMKTDQIETDEKPKINKWVRNFALLS